MEDTMPDLAALAPYQHEANVIATAVVIETIANSGGRYTAKTVKELYAKVRSGICGERGYPLPTAYQHGLRIAALSEITQFEQWLAPAPPKKPEPDTMLAANAPAPPKKLSGSVRLRKVAPRAHPIAQDTDHLRLPAVLLATGLSKTGLYDAMRAGTFPQQVPLGLRAVGWVRAEVSKWNSDRVLARTAESGHMSGHQ
jgi:prophage regulatory protein